MTDQEVLLSRILEEISHGDRAFFDSLSDKEKSLALTMLQQLQADSDSVPSLDALWELDYLRKPVDVMTFLTNKDYLGMEIIRNMDDESRTGGVFEAWADTLVELFRPDKTYWELILSCSIGTGKTSVAVLALVYKLYRMSCLRDPQKFYGLMPGHSIVFGVYNIFKYKARSVAASYMMEAIDRCPYFQEIYPRNDRKVLDIEFPTRIKVSYGASALDAIGENIFSVLIDETEFMKAAATEEEKGQAWNLYNSTLRRMESRYMRGGEIPGLMIQISSKASSDSYLAERIKSRGSADDVLIVEKTSWDIKPWRYSGKRFWLFKGDTHSDPRIMDEAEYAITEDKTHIISVPVEHKTAFVEDIHGALRDLANVASGATSPLIPRRDRIFSCVDSSRLHPFTKMEFHISIDDDENIEDFLQIEAIARTVKSQFQPKVRPTVPRYIHVDLAVSGDACGFAMGHVADFEIIKRADPNNDGIVHEIRAPRIYIDMILRVIPKKGSKIRLSAIRDFIFALRSYGFAISKVSADTYQSTDMLQQLARSGFETETLSVDVANDKSGHPYAFLREAIMEHRISYYHYPHFLAEAANLQRFDIVSQGRIKWKVDHPQKMNDLDGNPIPGSKDLTDAVSGVTRHCMMQLPDVDPPAMSPADALLKMSAAQSKQRFMQTSDWAVGDDYQP